MLEKFNKKQLISLVVGVLMLIILVFGASYAYFGVTSGTATGTTTITGDIGGGQFGTVTLAGGNTELYLNASLEDMSELYAGTTYYSSTIEGSRETNADSIGKTTYTATLSGDTTDSVLYACDYEFTVTTNVKENGNPVAISSLSSLSSVELVFEGDVATNFGLNVGEGTTKVSGTWYGINNSNSERSFDAYLKLTNTSSTQNDIAGKNITVEIANTNWNCYLSDKLGETYALLLLPQGVEESSAIRTLTIGKFQSKPVVGSTFNGDTIMAVYEDIETTNWTGSVNGDYYTSNVPWSNVGVAEINILHEIKPISIKGWFNGVGGTIDLTKLDTSLITDMSGMFFGSYAFDIVGLEDLDTSNVTDMSHMFEKSQISGTYNKLNWNTTKVTNMKNMFYMSTKVFDLSEFDVSNVLDMSYMFNMTSIDTDLGISGWNTSNVTNMSYMFNFAILNVNLNLSSWNVLNVTSHEGFDAIYAEGSTGTLTLPTAWQTN